jgi:hypothetical protein
MPRNAGCMGLMSLHFARLIILKLRLPSIRTVRANQAASSEVVLANIGRNSLLLQVKCVSPGVIKEPSSHCYGDWWATPEYIIQSYIQGSRVGSYIIMINTFLVAFTAWLNVEGPRLPLGRRRTGWSNKRELLINHCVLVRPSIDVLLL